jgi:hypothetical protein
VRSVARGADPRALPQAAADRHRYGRSQSFDDQWLELRVSPDGTVIIKSEKSRVTLTDALVSLHLVYNIIEAHELIGFRLRFARRLCKT